MSDLPPVVDPLGDTEPSEPVQKHSRLHGLLYGKPRDIHDPSLFHSISLVPFLAWVGLGVDGLSSCAYGPDESFRALFDIPHWGTHPEIALLLALATALTVGIISWSYTALIEHFPYSGGGYGVASKLLGPFFGLVSGCALLVDYVLTITTSIASSIDQVFNLWPEYAGWKLPVELLLTCALIVLNLRGLKESIRVIVPIFLLFCVTHVALMAGIFIFHPGAGSLASHAQAIQQGVRTDTHNLGLWVLFVIFLQAYSRGAGTYTGIEAVSNGVSCMRAPQIPNAKRTMVYMAISLAVTAGGLMLCYLIADLHPVPDRTMNGLLVEKLNWGPWFTWLTLGSEAGLLLFAAQTGYIGGPRVMANMALDGWIPRRFSSLSDRLTSHYGVLLVGAAAIGSLLYTRGSVDVLVTMYAINVFVTFSLSQMGMAKYFWAKRAAEKVAARIALHAVSLVLCVGILIAVVILKFAQGAWITLLVTGVLILACWFMHRHYERIRAKLAELNRQLGDMQTLVGDSKTSTEPQPPLDPKKQTAVILVNAYSGLGIHTMLIILKTFPGLFKQAYFASVGVLDSGNFKGTDEVVKLEHDRRQTIDKFVRLAQSLGLQADGEYILGTDPVAESTLLCQKIRERFPRSVFFAGKLLFENEKWYYPLLHNETAYAITRRLQLQGIPMVVMPIRILKFKG